MSDLFGVGILLKKEADESALGWATASVSELVGGSGHDWFMTMFLVGCCLLLCIPTPS
jgi:hypothetical protein